MYESIVTVLTETIMDGKAVSASARIVDLTNVPEGSPPPVTEKAPAPTITQVQWKVKGQGFQRNRKPCPT